MTDNFHPLDTESELIDTLKRLDLESLDMVLAYARRMLARQDMARHGITPEAWARVPLLVRIKIAAWVWLSIRWSRLWQFFRGGV